MMPLLAGIAIGAVASLWLRARIDHLASFRIGFQAGMSLAHLSREDQVRGACHAAVAHELAQ